MTDTKRLAEELRKRILPEHGGTADSYKHHWNLNPKDSLLHKEAADLIARLPEIQGQRDEALRLLRKCRNEMAGLPHSLGYAFTHLPELDKTLAASDESMSAIGDAGEKGNG